jgi:YVTN family beta-propeller protein
VAIPDSNLVVAIDPVARTIDKRIPVGDQPFAVAVNPVTNWVYVIDHPLAGNSRTTYVIDAAAGAVVATIPTSYLLGSVAVDVVNNRVYAGARVNSFLLVIDGATDTFASLMNVGTGFFDSEFGVAVDAGNGHAYTANYSSSGISRLRF